MNKLPRPPYGLAKEAVEATMADRPKQRLLEGSFAVSDKADKDWTALRVERITAYLADGEAVYRSIAGHSKIDHRLCITIPEWHRFRAWLQHNAIATDAKGRVFLCLDGDMSFTFLGRHVLVDQ